MNRPNHPWGRSPLCRCKTAQRLNKHRSSPPMATGPHRQAQTSSRLPKGASSLLLPLPHRHRFAPKKKKTGIIVAIAIIAALLVGMGGCAACAAVLSTTLDDADDNWHAHNDFGQEYQNYSAPISEQEFLNRETRTDFGLVGSTALNGAELDAVQSSYFGNASKAPDANGKYAAGVYRVGTDMPAGNYWFTGNKSSLSTFYILQPTLRELPPTTPCTSIAITATISWTCAKAKCSSSTTRGTMLPLDQVTESFTPPWQRRIPRWRRYPRGYLPTCGGRWR